jgi:hypothetical protein
VATDIAQHRSVFRKDGVGCTPWFRDKHRCERLAMSKWCEEPLSPGNKMRPPITEQATLIYRIVTSRNALTSGAHTAIPSRRDPNPQ